MPRKRRPATETPTPTPVPPLQSEGAGEGAAAATSASPDAAPDAAADAAAPGAGGPAADAPAAGDAAPAAPELVAEPEIAPAIQEILDRLPTEPGVYLMKDKKGRIIYVGKASNLRARVRSYFNRSGDSRAFVRLLHRWLGDIETVVTDNEKEALLLENNLIKQHKPRFNVKLVDDKSYLVLRLDPRARYPRLEVGRRMRGDGARYFGPYHSATGCRQTLKVVNRHFKLRTCTDQVLNSRKRPCLQYQIKRCDAPCVFDVPAEQYAEQVRDVALFLEGKDDELISRLRERMLRASDEEMFEVAAALRDQLRALEQTLQEQHMVSEKFVDQDVIGMHREGDVLEVAVLTVREGKLLGRRAFRFTNQEFPDDESISSFVGLYYDGGAVIPDEVLLPVVIEDAAAKQEWLREKSEGQPGRRRKVFVMTPQRGPRKKLVELSCKNAQVSYSSRRDKQRDVEDALEKLQRRLGLKAVPRRIECFDISHFQGSFTVASRVVFLDGEPARHLYRTFRVRGAQNDDFASMYEVLSRRFRRALTTASARGEAVEAPGEVPWSSALAAARKQAALLPVQTAKPAIAPEIALESPAEPEPDEAEVAEAMAEAAGGAADNASGCEAAPGEDGDESWSLPDLLLIDGGKGQLMTGLAALKDVGINWATQLDVIGLAKEREDQSGERQPDRVFLPRTKDPIRLRDNTAEMFVLSRIRDEAHRFAVSFHQRLREKRTIRSQLADIPGVGPKRQAALLRALGSVRRIQQCTVEELAAVPGMTQRAAQAVAAFFGSLSVVASAAPAAPAEAPAPPAPPPAPSAAPAPTAPPDEAPAAAPARSDLLREDIAEDAAERELSALASDDSSGAATEEVLAAQVAELAQAAATRD
ncbi:MAG: excinuclease ABC subunit UvrC [Polyangia bacterium]